jgi:hypothetical protein
MLLAVNGFVAFWIKKGRPLPPVMFLIVSGLKNSTELKNATRFL